MNLHFQVDFDSNQKFFHMKYKFHNLYIGLLYRSTLSE